MSFPQPYDLTLERDDFVLELSRQSVADVSPLTQHKASSAHEAITPAFIACEIRTVRESFSQLPRFQANHSAIDANTTFSLVLKPLSDPFLKDRPP